MDSFYSTFITFLFWSSKMWLLGLSMEGEKPLRFH